MEKTPGYFERGKQPCNDFIPEDSHRVMGYTHHCPLCGGERVFCKSCCKDHHKNGWDTCDSPF